MKIYRANIVYSRSRDDLAVFRDSYIAVENGVVEGIYEQLPEKFAALPVRNFGSGVMIPAFSDLHVHAPQYPQRGLGMDLLLEDWLNTYTETSKITLIETGQIHCLIVAFIPWMVA